MKPRFVRKKTVNISKANERERERERSVIVVAGSLKMVYLLNCFVG